MRGLELIAGIAVIAVVLWDVFETIILPRRVTRRIRLAAIFYRWTWRPCRFIARRIRGQKRREWLLSIYGPLSLLFLFALWAITMVVGFAILHHSQGSALNSPISPLDRGGFSTDLYMSGSTFFTLGLGDVTPRSEAARIITVFEAGMGLGFFALLISYLPVLYGAFSRREVNISLLDARAGSPPSAAEILRRHAQSHSISALEDYLRGWETWAAELMESHLSYPVLCYFRSQHDNQSWLAALASILDLSAFLLAYGDGALRWQAKLTFAISRHALVDLSQALNAPPREFADNRISGSQAEKLRALLAEAMRSDSRALSSIQRPAFLQTNDCGAMQTSNLGAECHRRLTELRRMYEPYVEALSERLLMPVAPWAPDAHVRDNWRTSAWARISRVELESSALAPADDPEHF